MHLKVCFPGNLICPPQRVCFKVQRVVDIIHAEKDIEEEALSTFCVIEYHFISPNLRTACCMVTSARYSLDEWLLCSGKLAEC